MHRSLVALLLALGLVASACGSQEVTSAGPDVSGLTAPTASGGQIDFGSLEGTDAVLWFWAPW